MTISGDAAEERITHLAARGDGVGEQGRYVAGAIPGDRITADGTIIPGAHRAVPPCSHFGTCGGCQLQHADDIVLADFVRGRIAGALARSGIDAGHIHAAHLSPPGTRRRAGFRAVLDRGALRLGFNARASRNVVDLAECHIVRPAILSCVEALRPVLRALLRPGQAVGIMITETPSGFDLALEGVDEIAPAVLPDLAGFAAAAGIARFSIAGQGGTETVLERARPTVKFGEVPVALPPGGFLQATRDAERALQDAVASICTGAATVADLFCGIGTFALPLARNAPVVAADAAGPAIAALAAAARQARLPVKTLHRDLFRQPVRAAEFKQEVVIVDPPRAGARAQIDEIAKSDVAQLAYVSCNPNTFARDAKILDKAGFVLTELWPVGQFRWSLHVELAAAFRR